MVQLLYGPDENAVFVSRKKLPDPQIKDALLYVQEILKIGFDLLRNSFRSTAVAKFFVQRVTAVFLHFCATCFELPSNKNTMINKTNE